MPVYTEQELLKILKEGLRKEYAFNILMDLYKEKLYKHIRRILISHEDTDDALQNTFVKAWFGLNNFREDSSLFTWLYKISTNEALTLLRKKKKINTYIKSGENEGFDQPESDINVNGEYILSKLQKAVLSLPDKQRAVFNMKYFDDLKYEEIADLTKTSVGALKASYHLAVKKIENFMKSH